jgi:transposase InsO family protein
MSNTLYATIATDGLTMAVKSMSRAGNCYDNAMMESL